MAILEETGLNPYKTAVLIIDVQNDFLAAIPGCAYHDRMLENRREADILIMQDKIRGCFAPFVERARDSGAYIIHIRSIYPAGTFNDMPNLCTPGTIGAEPYEIGYE